MSLAVLTARARWHLEAKRAVVRALAKGIVTAEQVKEVHGLTDEELAEWRRKYSHGREGVPA